MVESNDLDNIPAPEDEAQEELPNEEEFEIPTGKFSIKRLETYSS